LETFFVLGSGLFVNRSSFSFSFFVLEAGSWKLEAGSGKREAGSWKLEA